MLFFYIRRFIANGNGATAVEYALLAGLIGVGLIALFALMGDTVDSVLTDTATGL